MKIANKKPIETEANWEGLNMRFASEQQKAITGKLSTVSRANKHGANTQGALLHYLSLASLVSMTVIFLVAISV